MEGLVAGNGSELIPRVPRREYEAVGPIAIVLHQATTCGAADQGAQGGPCGDLGEMLEVTKSRGGFAPRIKTKHRMTNRGHTLQEQIVESHIPRRRRRAIMQTSPNLTHRFLGFDRTRR